MQFVTIEKQWQVGDAERPQEAAAHVPNHRARACVLKVTTVPPSRRFRLVAAMRQALEKTMADWQVTGRSQKKKI
jgi:hypothetical protein